MWQGPLGQELQELSGNKINRACLSLQANIPKQLCSPIIAVINYKIIIRRKIKSNAIIYTAIFIMIKNKQVYIGAILYATLLPSFMLLVN